jgi:hypothetical protein
MPASKEAREAALAAKKARQPSTQPPKPKKIKDDLDAVPVGRRKSAPLSSLSEDELDQALREAEERVANQTERLDRYASIQASIARHREERARQREADAFALTVRMAPDAEPAGDISDLSDLIDPEAVPGTEQ